MVSRLVHQSVSWSVDQLVSRSVSQSGGQLVSQSVGQSCQSASWSVSQLVSQSKSRSVCGSVCQIVGQFKAVTTVLLNKKRTLITKTLVNQKQECTSASPHCKPAPALHTHQECLRIVHVKCRFHRSQKTCWYDTIIHEVLETTLYTITTWYDKTRPLMKYISLEAHQKGFKKWVGTGFTSLDQLTPKIHQLAKYTETQFLGLKSKMEREF